MSVNMYMVYMYIVCVPVYIFRYTYNICIYTLMSNLTSVFTALQYYVILIWMWRRRPLAIIFTCICSLSIVGLTPPALCPALFCSLLAIRMPVAAFCCALSLAPDFIPPPRDPHCWYLWCRIQLLCRASEKGLSSEWSLPVKLCLANSWAQEFTSASPTPSDHLSERYFHSEECSATPHCLAY